VRPRRPRDLNRDAAACDDLMLPVAGRRAEALATPLQAPGVAVDQLVVEHERGLQLRGDGQWHQRRELFPGADGGTS
jgi:hypothetical protein